MLVVVIMLLAQVAVVALQVTTAARTAPARATVAPAAGEYQSVTATRVVDSRSGLGVPGGTAQQLSGGTTWNVTVSGVGGVPTTGVLAVALNLTTVNSSGSHVLTVWPAGDTRPGTSTLNETTAGAVNNMAVVPIGANGQISIYQSSGLTDVLVDLVGYVTNASDTSAAGTYAPLTPARAFDTRTGAGGTTGPVAAGATFSEQITGVGGVPTSGVSAVAINIGATNASSNGYLTVWAAGQTRPSASSVETFSAYTTQKLLIVPLGTGGKISIYASPAANVQVFGDIAGYYLAPTASTSGDTFIPVNSARIVDTRTGLGGVHAQLGPASTTAFTVTGAGGIPLTGADTAVLNLTAVNATSTGGYMTAYADGTTRPGVSTLQVSPGFTQSNLAFVPIGSDGKIAVYLNANNADLVIDVEGYYKHNTQPSKATGLALSPGQTTSGTLYSAAAQPTLTATTTDLDGGYVRDDFEVYAGNSQTPTTLVASGNTGTTPSVSQGGPGSWRVPSTAGLVEGGTYEYRVRGFDGLAYGAWSSYQPFTVDLTPPAVPTVTSTAFPSGAWTASTSGSVSWSDTSSDVTSYSYALDNAAATVTTAASATLSNVVQGAHTLHVLAIDKAGNTARNDYSFDVDGLLAPSDQLRTQDSLNVQAGYTADMGYVDYRYQLGTTGGFNLIPTTDVTMPGGSTHPTWPDPRGSGGAFSPWTWNVAQTVTNAGGTDGVVELEACYSATTDNSSPTCTTPVNVVLARTDFSGSSATRQVGPGTLSLLTGNLSVSATDASVPSAVGSLSVGRSLTTLAPASGSDPTNGVFGPAWAADLPGADAGAADESLADDSASDGTVVLTDSTGTESVYAAVPGKTNTYAGTADDNDGSIITKDSSTQFTLTDVDGTKTVWVAQTVGTSTVWAVDHVTEPGSSTTTSYTHDSSGRVTQIVGAAPTGISCSAPLTTVGCRTLKLTYASSTTATGTDSTTWGDYTGRLASISFIAADPATLTMSTTAIAQYAYDVNGMLRASWDPRISPALKTVYGYDSNHRLTSLTPPGLNGYTLSYDSSGRLSTIQRTDPANGTATTTVVYGVPFTGSGAPIELGVSTSGAWGETTDVPTIGTAVFGPDHVPAGTTASTVASSDWPYASLTYIDVNGRPVNSAAYGAGGWQVTTTSYDGSGNTISSLSARGRDEALNPSAYPDTDVYVAAQGDSKTRASLLSTVNTYSSDGTELVDTVGPMHPVQLDANSSGATVDARSHTHTTYDEGAPNSDVGPTGGPYRLATTVTTSAQTPDGTDNDTKTTQTGYAPINVGDTSGWDLGQPTTTTTVMSGGVANIVKTTRYDAQGWVIDTRMPSDPAGGTAGSTLTSYFTATGTGTCANAAEAGLVCQTQPASTTTTNPGPGLPITTTTYNSFGQPTTVTEASTTSGSTTTRTTTTSYDAADRPTTVHVAITPVGAAGTDVPDTTTGYDSNTGLAVSESTTGATLTTGYDALGRATSYIDADGNTTSMSYDIDGRVTSVNDGKGTTTYVYDSSTEHRGLVTSMSTGMGTNPSTFSAAYGPDGGLTSETYPSGLVATRHTDDVGETTTLSYDGNNGAGGTDNWMTFSAAYSIGGQIRHETSPDSVDGYVYDNAGRLTAVQDTYTPGGAQCTTRTYAYDANSNRTESSSYPDAGTDLVNGACSTTTIATTASHSYDEADRLIDSGYTYDALGRTTAAPSAAADGNGGLSLAYYTTDMLQSETQHQTSGDVTDSWTLDLLGNRYRGQTDGATGLTYTNHYSDGGDSPSWIAVSDGTWTRNVVGIDGNLGAVQDSTGHVQLQLTNLHGDVVATADDATTATDVNDYFESTEFGVARASNTATPRYGWLGGKRRSSDSIAGLTLMGQRLYDPTLGRFLQTDPVRGGSANNYDYANQDPINQFDVAGTCSSRHWWCRAYHWGRHHAPNYVSFNFGFYSPYLLGAGVNLTVTNGWHGYGGFYGGLGTPGPVASARAGWMFGRHRQRDVDDYVKGTTVGFDAAARGASLGLTWGRPLHGGRRSFSGEIGVGTPGVSVSVGYSWRLW